MFRTVEVLSPDDRARFCSLAGHPLDPDTVERQKPGASWLVTDEAGNAAGRCSLWWEGTPEHEGRRVGYVGHYAVTDGRAAPELLHRACARLAAKGCGLAVGPCDGNTWRRYRLVTERGTEPPFFLEPDNPDEWPGQWADAGFSPLAHYYSALNPDLGAVDPRMMAAAQRLHDDGVDVHPLDAGRFDEELPRVHALSLVAFRDNFLYTPIGEEEFVAQYAPIRPYLRPELVLLAERRGELIGYLFGIPDLLRARRGGPMDTVILKTMAVHPDHAGKGLGGLLMARCHEAARQAGFTRAIHALFHESNRSGRISGRTARVFRRYTLFARPLL